MKIWISIILLNIVIVPQSSAVYIEFSYTLDHTSFGYGSFDYDYTNTTTPVTNYTLNNSNWGTPSYSSYISNNKRNISIRAVSGISFADILLGTEDINSHAYPEILSLDNYTSRIFLIGSAYSTTIPVYTIVSLGEPAVVPLPATAWLFISGILALSRLSIYRRQPNNLKPYNKTHNNVFKIDREKNGALT